MAPKKGKVKQAEEETSSFVSECKSLFGTDSLYSILNLEKDQLKTGREKENESKIKKAYYKASLKYHPDRQKIDSSDGKDSSCCSQDVATRKFQIIGKAYSILSDSDKRAVYDETGAVDEDDGIMEERDWEAYWRLFFAPVTLNDLENFKQSYKGSEEELNDLKQSYTAHEGDMNKIMQDIMCSTHEDEVRFSEILKNLISEGEIADFPKFSRESDRKKTARKRKAQKEATEAKAALAEIKSKSRENFNGASDSLTKMIQRKQGDRMRAGESFLDNLAEKYTTGAKAKSKKPKK